jgi:hypothetical protein
MSDGDKMDDGIPQGGETASERTARIRREAEVIANAHADIDAGLGIEDDAMEAWLEELDANPYAPLPSSRASALRS